MKPDATERELLRLARALADGGAMDWKDRKSTDPALASGIEGLRDIEVLAAAMSRDPEPLDSGPQARAWLTPGSMLGRYPVEREAGRGGMGVVYLARDPVLDRPVALKLLPPDVGRSSERLARFTREAKLLASLNHPNVATIHGLEEESTGLRFLVLEWVAGESLAARLKRGAMPWREALEVCGQIARGLAAAHEGGVIHRDLKPGNVMITPQGRVKVLDFGLARRGVAPGDLPAGPSDPGVKGTWGYVSPECLTRDEDYRADVFAFGCVLYECLAGAPAFPGESVDEIQDALLRREPDEARLPADTPAAIRRLIASCVAKDPSRRLGSMAEALRTLEVALGRSQEPIAARSGAATATPHRLPYEMDVFVGREVELGELSGRLRRGARLVTLKGAGGIGKTRLIVRYGWRSLEEWPGGVWFCDLTEASARDDVAGAVARVLGVPLGHADPVEQLGRAIAARGRCLLILDNFEQVVTEAGATIARWLALAPEAQFAVTSRERLDLPAEDVLAIEPLESAPGFELFVERVRRHSAGYEPEGQEAKSVREVVQLVEGIPLAIELAAARVRVISPAEIAARMHQRLRLLAGPGGGRHGTLRAAIDVSWELLDPWEQAAFAQCAVFEGGFTLEAAEAVADLEAWIEAPWLLDVVQALVDKSLLRTWIPERDGSGAEPASRFGMFVSLQEYAREKLEKDGAVHAALHRHGTWFALRGADDAIDALSTHGGVQRRIALARDLENLVAACRRASARQDHSTAIATYGAAFEVLLFRGPTTAAVDLGRELLRGEQPDEDRGRALTILGNAEWRSGLVTEGIDHLEAGLAIHVQRGDRRWEAITLATLGSLYVVQGRSSESRPRLEAALGITRVLRDRQREALVLARLGQANDHQGRVEEARSQLEQALTISREVGDRAQEGQVLGVLGNLYRDRGLVDEARTHLESALSIAHETGNRRFAGITTVNLANLEADQGRVDEALARYESAGEIARDVGNRSAEGSALSGIGTLLLTVGRLNEARPRLEAALAIVREAGYRPFEGHVLGALGKLHAAQGRLEEARQCIDRGSRILREIDDRLGMGRLMCAGIDLERRCGNLVAARELLREVEQLVAEIGIGPDTNVGRMVSQEREALAREP